MVSKASSRCGTYPSIIFQLSQALPEQVAKPSAKICCISWAYSSASSLLMDSDRYKSTNKEVIGLSTKYCLVDRSSSSASLNKEKMSSFEAISGNLKKRSNAFLAFRLLDRSG